MRGLMEEQKPAETDPVIRPEVVHLLVPTHRPEILAYKLNAFERVGKVWLSVAESTKVARNDTRRPRVERIHVPFSDIRANMHPDCF